MLPDDVYVILSTYNGTRHLQALIDSIQRQTFTEWRLLVRDDGSSDATLGIVEQAARHDTRITLLSDDHRNVGAPGSFGLLLAEARRRGARYVFLADQDDVWLDSKLARLLATMASAEAGTDRNVPVLVYSDLVIVSDDLRLIHPSFRRHHRLQLPRGADVLPALLAQNAVTGCAALLNRALLDIVVPVPERVAMHDWWIAQCAAATGMIVGIDEPTVLYRQHGGNVVGSKGVMALLRDMARSPREWWERGQRNFRSGIEQAKMLALRLEAHATSSRGAVSRELVRAYCDALDPALPAVARLRRVRRLGVRPMTRLPRTLYYARVLRYGAGSSASSIGS